MQPQAAAGRACLPTLLLLLLLEVQEQLLLGAQRREDLLQAVQSISNLLRAGPRQAAGRQAAAGCSAQECRQAAAAGKAWQA